VSGKFDYDRIINGPNDNISNKIILLVIKKYIADYHMQNLLIGLHAIIYSMK